MEIVAVEDQKKPPEQPFVSGATPVTLVGGGALRRVDLEAALAIGPTLIAVDGGADAAVEAGFVPVAVIGDLDSVSLSFRTRFAQTRVHEVSEQDSTDFDKALRHLDVPLVLAVGFTGARLDHELAVFHTLVARPGQRCIVIGERDVVFLAPPWLRLDLAAGTRVSLFPMAAVTGRSTGLRWPIDGLAFHPAQRIGTSNMATGGPVEIETDAPGLLVILPREDLGAAIAALSAAVESLWIV
jgi:thiamine pyrophosphokinase